MCLTFGKIAQIKDSAQSPNFGIFFSNLIWLVFVYKFYKKDKQFKK